MKLRKYRNTGIVRHTIVTACSKITGVQKYSLIRYTVINRDDFYYAAKHADNTYGMQLAASRIFLRPSFRSARFPHVLGEIYHETRALSRRQTSLVDIFICMYTVRYERARQAIYYGLRHAAVRFAQ